MKLRITVFFILLVSLINIPNLFSQDENQANPLEPGQRRAMFNIGPVFGFNSSKHSVNLASFAQDPLCPSFSDGSDNGFFVGLNTEIFFLGQKRTDQSIIVRLLYNTFPSSFEVQTNDVYPSNVSQNGKDTIVMSATSNTLKVVYNVITFEFQYKFNPVYNFGIIIGPTFDFAIKKTLTQDLNLIAAPNVQFKEDSGAIARGGVYTNNDRTLVVSDGPIQNSSSFRLGIKAGVQYEFDLPGLGKIVPSANYNFGVTKLSAAENWRVNAFQIGVDIRFQIKRFFGL